MKVRLTITGVEPLLMHSDRLSDPLDPWAMKLHEVSSKRKKTDDDHREMARLEWRGSLYWSERSGPYIPGRNIEKCLVEGARISRAGRQVERGLFVLTNEASLRYDGPTDPEELWKDERFRDRRSVGVAQRRVMRTRPVFPEWSMAVEAELDTSVLGLDELGRIAQEAGRQVGLGDFRPRYGRFTATVEPGE
jgi:hypothetical protein